ncbi:MAG: shikimate dehydrogenase [Chromatiaceae bacterium]|nr:MAG: shikimate dehydrogenase [Chromatiaceae bacterium]
MTDYYAVIGNPIAHSKSPLIHAAFARQTGQHMTYGRLLGSREDFAGSVRDFVAAGGRGLNVTLPFKQQACALLGDLTPRAAAAGAVNTILVQDGGRLHGDNTDGVGLVRDLEQNLGLTLRGRRILLVGAGGAGRGVLPALCAAAPAHLLIANRTAATARAVAADLAPAVAGVALAGVGLEALAGQRFDLLINATSAGLDGAVPALPADCIASGGSVYDLFYSDTPTAFCRWGLAHGAVQVHDGLGMLVEQAAESFFLWRGVRPQTAPVIAALRARRAPADPG